MQTRTLSVLSAVALVDELTGPVEAAQVLGMETELAVDPVDAARCALAMATETDFPAPVREFGRMMVRSIRCRARGKIARANVYERKAGQSFDSFPSAYRW